MFRRVLHDLFVRDVLLKALSLALAVVLFVVVRGDRDAATVVHAKVMYVLPEDRVLVSDPLHEVKLGVRGPWTRVSRFGENDIDAIRIDLGHVSDGDLYFREDMVKLPVGLRVASITPLSIKVRFEPKETRVVPVQAILGGEPAAGFRAGRPEVHPREVRIVGAKSVIQAVQVALTRPLSISDARERVSGDVALDAPPPHAQWDAPALIDVSVDIVPALAEHKLAGMPVLVTGQARLDARVAPATADVVLRGQSELLATMPPGVPTLIVDVAAEDNRSPGAFRKRVSVVGLPTGIAAEVRPESVTVVTYRRRD